MKKRRDKKAIFTGGGERKYERQALEHTDTQSCPGGTMLVTWVPKKGVYTVFVFFLDTRRRLV